MFILPRKTVKTSNTNIAEDKDFGGVSIEALVKEFGSPLFILSEQTLRARYRELNAALVKEYPVFSIAYSYKTNYLPRICKILKEEGALAEVVSGFEYSLAKKLGYSGAEVVFNGPMKREEDIARALRDGAILNIDNHEELVRVAHYAKELGLQSNVGIRLNSSDPILRIGKDEWTRFGFNIESGEAERACAKIAEDRHLILKGFHMHLATNIADPSVYERAAEILCTFVLKIKRLYNIEVEYIDMGGGFGVKNLRPRYREFWDVPPVEYFIQAMARPIQQKLTPSPRLIIEPGRFLVAECMAFVTRVIAARYNGPGSAHVVVDGSTSMIPTATTHWHPIHDCIPDKRNEITTVVFGSSCTPLDILGIAPLPTLKENDILLMEHCGAYSLSRSSQFISPRPPVISVDSAGLTKVVRRRESEEDLTHLDLW